MDSTKDDKGYSQIWAMNEATRIRAERRCDYIISQLPLASAGKILEIGCGLGSNAFMMAQKTGAEVLATDVCVPFISSAQERYQLPNLRYKVQDFHCLDQFGDETFDYIVGNGILHHLFSQLDAALASVHSLLNPGGQIVFLEPNIYNPYVYLLFSYPWLRRQAHLDPDEMAFSRRFVTGQLQHAGYQNIHVEFRDFLIPGIPTFLIQPSIFIGDLLEKFPLLSFLAQSIFISASK